MSTQKNINIHHKRGATEVWHITHFRVSHGKCVTSESPMGQSEGAP